MPDNTNRVLRTQPGKHYRWTVEGVGASSDGEDGYLKMDDLSAWLSPRTLDRGFLELIPDPIPNKPGTVIRSNIDGGILMCVANSTIKRGYRWVTSSGGYVYNFTPDPAMFTLIPTDVTETP